jgi:hypothetical protein
LRPAFDDVSGGDRAGERVVVIARSTGHIGSLMTLINRGCQRAVRSGEEKLTTELLDKVKIDAASENARRELELAIDTGKMRVRHKAG